jgi:type II secretory pathway pseudopilin PulG
MADVLMAVRAGRVLHIEQAGRSSLPPPTAPRRQRLRGLGKNDSGNSLIEISMVTVLLSALAAMAGLSVSGGTDHAVATACTADVRNVRAAEEAFFLQTDAYAPTVEALTAAGLLKTAPPAGEVTITVAGEPQPGVTVTGSATSTCIGFVG